jgi:F1F0 ATPase subunit 2
MTWIDLPALTGGGLLSLIFFGGLWLTVRKSLLSGRPWLWFLSSFAVRTSLTIAGFVMFTGGSLTRLICCTAGFVAVKMLLVALALPSRRSGGGNLQNGEEPCT